MSGTGVKILRNKKPLDEAGISDNIPTAEIDKILGGLTAFQSITNAFSRVVNLLRSLLKKSDGHEKRIATLEKQLGVLMERDRIEELVKEISLEEDGKDLTYDELVKQARTRLDN